MDDVDTTAMYRSGRERLIALGRRLTDEQAELVVAATPSWTVRDNCAHMAGVAADVLSGNLDGVATDPWTQAQVDERASRSLGQILDELEESGPSMDALIAAAGDAMDPRLFVDQWTHEQDIRGTLGIAGGGDAAVVRWGANLAVAGWVNAVAASELPALRVTCDETDHRSGPDAGVQLIVDSFDALRIATGRRSAAQLAALPWSGTGDPSPYFERLVMFSIPDDDIHDAR